MAMSREKVLTEDGGIRFQCRRCRRFVIDWPSRWPALLPPLCVGCVTEVLFGDGVSVERASALAVVATHLDDCSEGYDS
jgi:hypothetical protein